MKNLATLWTDLRRILSTSPEDWPHYTCPAGHQIAIPPSSRLWDKETGQPNARGRERETALFTFASSQSKQRGRPI